MGRHVVACGVLGLLVYCCGTAHAAVSVADDEWRKTQWQVRTYRIVTIALSVVSGVLLIATIVLAVLLGRFMKKMEHSASARTGGTWLSQQQQDRERCDSGVVWRGELTASTIAEDMDGSHTDMDIVWAANSRWARDSQIRAMRERQARTQQQSGLPPQVHPQQDPPQQQEEQMRDGRPAQGSQGTEGEVTSRSRRQGNEGVEEWSIDGF